MKDKCADRRAGSQWEGSCRCTVAGVQCGRLIAVLVAVTVALSLPVPARAREQLPPENKRIIPAKVPTTPKDTPAKPAESPTTPEAGDARPMISVDAPVHDFGVTWVGPVLEHSYKITNKGAKALEILKVRPSCGCTVAGTYPVRIEPGQTGEFPFSLDSHKVRGRYNKSVTITSNDPVNPEVKLSLAGECKRYVDVLPGAANFGRVFGAEKQEQVLKVTNNTEEPLKLELDVPPDSKFKFDLVETEPGKKFEVRVSLAAPPAEIEPGMLRTNAVLKTNKEAQKEIRVAATAAIPRRIEVQPEVISMRDAEGPLMEAAARTIRFTNYGTEPTRVVDAAVDDPDLTLTVSERAAGKQYDIRLEVPAGWKPPSAGRTITLRTDDKEMGAIKVPIKGPDQKTAEPTPREPKPAEQMTGNEAPRFNLKTTDGKPINNETLAGTVTVLDFWAPNCGFCKKQIPRVETIRQKYADKGVRFVAVSQTMRTKKSDEEIIDTLKETGFHGDLVIDSDNTLGPLFKATAFPTMVILGKTGKVEAVNVGNLGDLESRMEGQLDALLASKPVPPEGAATAEQKPKPQRPAMEMRGKPAPQFSLKTPEGKEVSTADFANHPATVLNFVAPNCGFCKRQLPNVEKIRAEYEKKGVRFVNVSQTMGKPFTVEDAAKTFKDAGANLEFAYDKDNAVGGMFQVTGFPTMVVVNRQGEVMAVNIGAKTDIDTLLKGQLDALITGKPVPTPEEPTAAAPQPPAPRKRPAEEMQGQPAPDFSLNTHEGKEVSNASFADHPATVLNFVAPNCGFCKRQLPNVEKIRAEYEKKGVRFVNMSETMRQEFTVEDAAKTFKDTGANLEFAYDKDNTVGRMFQITGFPTMVVVNREGKIEHVNIGAKQDIDMILKGQLDALIEGGKP